MNKAILPQTLLQLVSAILLFLSVPVIAQVDSSAEMESDDQTSESSERSDEADIDRIRVTTERREQSLQEVSSMVQAFDQDDLRKWGIGSEFNNLQNLIPGMNIANQEGNTEIFIRGVGSSNNTELGDPAATTHINGVYIARPRGLGAQFFDLERVEVHKGPQGTVRGRNAVAGTINLVTAKPKFDRVSGYIEAGFGNYDATEVQAALNVPLSETAAFRFASYSRDHDSQFNNAGLDTNLTPAGVVDELSGRGTFLWEPSDAMSLTVMADYTKEGGTGYPGANLFPAFRSAPEGLTFGDLEDRARDVIYRGHQGRLDSTNWGLQVNAIYDFGPFSVEYLGSRRDLDFQQTNGTSDSIAWDGRDISSVNYENQSGQWWLTESTSDIHEIRFFAPDDARFRWSAGAFYFEEDQGVGFLTTQDFGNFYSGTEFTMPDVQSESLAFYADGEFDVSDRFRVLAGIRYTDEEKSRFGIGGNFAAGFGSLDFNCCFVTRFGTVGFQPAFLDRPTFQEPTTREEAIQFWLDAGTQYGIEDTFFEQFAGVLDGTMPNGTCIDTPDTDPNGNQVCPENGQHSFFSFFPEQSAPAQQQGSYAEDFIDWRVGFEFDLSLDNMVYGTISTGHRSGGFNDTLPNVGALAYDPEEVIAYEVGARNSFRLGNLPGPVIFNIASFLYDYSDQVFQQLVATGPASGPDETPPQSLLNVNVADSTIFGVEMESRVPFNHGFTAYANMLWLRPEIDNGEISDLRAQDFGNAANTPVAVLDGNRLPHASEFTFVGRIEQQIPVGNGYFDWQVLASYRSDYFLSVYNQRDIQYNDGTTGDAVALGFSDRQPGFWTVNLGAGWEPGDVDNLRIETYVTNLFDENVSQKALLGPNLNLRFLNQARTYGFRARYQF